MARIPYQVILKGKLHAAKVTTVKDRNGNESFQATVTNELDEVIGMGFGDTPYEACDNVR